MEPSKERERRRQRENSAREKREVKRERRKRCRRTCLCVAGVAGVRANRRCPRSTKVRCFSPSFFCCFFFFILSNRSGSGHPLQLQVLTRPDQTSLGATRRAPRASREARVGRAPSLGCAPGHRGGALGCASLRPAPQARASMRL